MDSRTIPLPRNSLFLIGANQSCPGFVDLRPACGHLHCRHHLWVLVLDEDNVDKLLASVRGGPDCTVIDDTHNVLCAGRPWVVKCPEYKSLSIQGIVPQKSPKGILSTNPCSEMALRTDMQAAIVEICLWSALDAYLDVDTPALIDQFVL